MCTILKLHRRFLTTTKQLWEHFCPSVRPSASRTFFIMFRSSYHHEISRNYHHWQNDVHTKALGQRLKVKVTEFNINFAPFLAFPERNYRLNLHMATKWCTKLALAQKRCPIVFRGHPLKWHKRGALLFFEVILQISRSHGLKIRRYWHKVANSGL